MAKFKVPFNGLFIDHDVMLYDEYIHHKTIGLIQKTKYCPYFKGAQSELKSLFGNMTHEKEALKKAEHKFTSGKNTLHYDILLLRNLSFYSAPLAILSEHLMRSLGWLTWAKGNWDESDYYALLQWYAETYGIQKAVSATIVLRECMDYAQAHVNAHNRIENTLIELICCEKPPAKVGIPQELINQYIENKPNPSDTELQNIVSFISKIEKWRIKNCIEDYNIKYDEILESYKRNIIKSYYREQLQWQLIRLVDDKLDVEKIKKATKEVRSFRNVWNHGNSQGLIKELQKPDLIESFVLSYKFITTQYEGLFLWYLNPIKNRIGSEKP